LIKDLNQYPTIILYDRLVLMVGYKGRTNVYLFTLSDKPFSYRV